MHLNDKLSLPVVEVVDVSSEAGCLHIALLSQHSMDHGRQSDRLPLRLFANSQPYHVQIVAVHLSIPCRTNRGSEASQAAPADQPNPWLRNVFHPA